jgi:prolactin regulatory element-binding protein
VTVDYLPLKSIDTKPGSRYVLQAAKSGIIGGLSINYLIIAFIVVIQLLLLQSYYSQQTGGGSTPQLLPKSWQDALAAYRERAMAMSSPLTRQVDRVTHTHTGQKIVDFLHTHHQDTKHLPDPAKKAIILSAPEEGTELSTEVHESTEDVLKQDAAAKKWEELSHSQQQQWKEKLKKAGAWSADYGETIFKGVFFSELAGAVGRAAAEAVGA